jgi:DNA-directed RNA polymerase specialized sigma24 family protein
MRDAFLAQDLRSMKTMAISYRQLEETVLVRFAQNDDTRAFDELVHRYQGEVYRLSYKILRHEHDAAEALHDVFLDAYRGLKDFKAGSTFSTWLYVIATNASLMKYRKRRDNWPAPGCSASSHVSPAATWTAAGAGGR